jgi:protocatechuate 3,4-dioxygenase alpha subunit
MAEPMAEPVDGRLPQTLPQTPSQTVGPFYGFALPFERGGELTPPWHADAIRVHGRVLDGAGAGIPDALVELWQADAAGRVIESRGAVTRDGVTVSGFGRVPTSNDGRYDFSTIKPGAARAGSAPYLLITVFARGLLHHLFTRAYFDDEGELNATDPLLASVDPARRGTLVARADGDRSYRFDIRLQGEAETVFLDFGNEV